MSSPSEGRHFEGRESVAALGVGNLQGPIARALPAGWRVPERMAAATLRLGRWEAGARLMVSARPQDWARLAAASDLQRVNRAKLAACRAALARSGRPQTCPITVGGGP